MDWVAVGSGELTDFFELTGLARGATELPSGEAAPTARSAGVTEGKARVEAGVGLMTVPDALAVDDGPGLGVGDVAAPGAKSFISSRRSSLFVLPLWA